MKFLEYEAHAPMAEAKMKEMMKWMTPDQKKSFETVRVQIPIGRGDLEGAAKAGEKVFLPFEGDSTLSIILSKAFLLANDKHIKDYKVDKIVEALKITRRAGMGLSASILKIPTPSPMPMARPRCSILR